MTRLAAFPKTPADDSDPARARAFPPNAILVMAPHPDDDILGCGHLMRQVAAEGGRVVIAWLTDGGGSHANLEGDAREALVARRREEALDSVEALGVQPEATYFLRVRDGFLSDGANAAKNQLEVIRRRHRLDAGFITAADDGHPDHRAAFHIALGLGFRRLYSYPISARYDGAAYEPPAGVITLFGDSGDAKRNALSRHRSQAEGAGAVYPMTAQAIDRFCGEPEIFIPIRA